MDNKKQVLNWLRDDGRYRALRSMIRFVNYEMVEGDILEFGVGNGKTLAMLSLLHKENLIQDGHTDPTTQQRNIIGFDSFAGLPAEENEHVRWHEGVFAGNYDADHPYLDLNKRLTPEVVLDLCQLIDVQDNVSIQKGLFEQTLASTIPTKLSKAAFIHIDCDLYASTKSVFSHIAPIIQEGTIIAFDDWFCYKANPRRGEQAAFREFLDNNAHFEALPYKSYGTHCNSFIMISS